MSSLATHVFELVKEGDVAALKELVNKQGKEVVEQTDRYGQSTLHIGVEIGRLEVVRYLLALGIDPNLTDRNGWTPLMVACTAGNLDIVELLLANKVPPCDVAKKSVDSSTALHYLVRKKPSSCGREKFFKLVQELVSRGCDPSTKNSNGDTPLHSAASAGRKSVVAFFKKLGVNMNETNRYGETCLHLAAVRGDESMVEELLALGVDPTIAGKRGTAKDVAAAAEKPEIVALLDERLNNKHGGSRIHLSHGNISDIIAQAKKTGRLNLSTMDLNEIPAEVFQLTNLVELNLSDNNIKVIPSDIKNLTALVSLKLDSNKLVDLPTELGYMTHIKELTITLNTGMSPIIKRKSRDGVTALLQHLKSYGVGAVAKRPSQTRLLSKKPSAPGLTYEDFVPENSSPPVIVGSFDTTTSSSLTPSDDTSESNGEDLDLVPEGEDDDEASYNSMLDSSTRGGGGGGGENSWNFDAKEKKLRDTLEILQNKNDELVRKANSLKQREKALEQQELELEHMRTKLKYQQQQQQEPKSKKRSSSERTMKLTPEKEWKVGNAKLSVNRDKEKKKVVVEVKTSSGACVYLSVHDWQKLQKVMKEVDRAIDDMGGNVSSGEAV